MGQTIVVLGARNLGGAIAEHFLDLGWNAAAVARSEESLLVAKERGALGIIADASDPDALARALQRAREEFGSVDAVVNAITAHVPPTAVRSGVERSPMPTWRPSAGGRSPLRSRRLSFSAGTRALKASGGGALVQITGGSSRRAMPGKGLWAAGAFATRALVQAAAQELRTEGIHVALLAVDATIASPKTAGYTRDAAPNALADMGQVASAVEFLVLQGDRAYTHDLVVTPAGDTWVP